MSFCKVNDVDNLIKSFLSPRELITIELVSKSGESTIPWKKLGYDNKMDFLIIYKLLKSYADDDGKETTLKVQKFLMTGTILGKVAMEILKQDEFGIQWCTTIWGIESIALQILTPTQIGKMTPLQRDWSLSEGGFELMRRKILTLDEIGAMDHYNERLWSLEGNGLELVKRKILTYKQIGAMEENFRKLLLRSDKATKMLIDGTLKVDEALKMSNEQLQKLLATN